MAHANIEFVAALMRPTPVPVCSEARDLPTFRDLRERMASVEWRIKNNAFVSDEDRRVWDLYQRGLRDSRQQRRIRAAEPTSPRTPPAGGAMGARAPKGEQFIEPRRRIPLDVQAGRVKVRRARPL